MQNSSALKLTLLWLTFYSIAMGFFESAVVVYLRELYYPEGFDFPMVTMTGKVAFTEIFREVATMIMLVTVACIAGESNIKRFAWFLYCFAVWDIFYYIFLKILIDWPTSLLTWDVLFLIPVVWTGPVISPVIISITMILLALLIVFVDVRSSQATTNLFIFTGALIIILSFIWDFSSWFLSRHSFAELFNFTVHQTVLKQYIPDQFNWWLFITGEILILAGLSLSFLKGKKAKLL